MHSCSDAAEKIHSRKWGVTKYTTYQQMHLPQRCFNSNSAARKMPQQMQYHHAAAEYTQNARNEPATSYLLYSRSHSSAIRAHQAQAAAYIFFFSLSLLLSFCFLSPDVRRGAQ